MRDALKNYLALANGLTEVTRQRAEAAARALVAQGEAAAEQVSTLAEDLLAASRANRETVSNLVRTEVDKALSRVGLVTADEVARLQRRLQAVESTVRGVGATTSAFATTAARKATSKSAGRRAAPFRVGSGGAAQTSSAATTTVTKPAVKKPAVKKPAVKKPAVKKPAVKKPAKKSG